MSGWSLNAAELRIPHGSRIAAHRMLVVADPSRRAVRQINGLASWYDRGLGRWRHKPIGYLWSDRLRGYDTLTHPDTFMPINGCRGPAWDVANAVAADAVKVLVDGLSVRNLADRLAPVLEVVRHVNALSEGPEGGAGLPYPFLGFGRNSNSFFSTVLAAMGLEEPRFGRAAWLAPGSGRSLIDRDSLPARVGGDSMARDLA